MKPATFDLLGAIRKIAPRPSPSGARTTLDRSQVEILAGALLSHLDLLDAPEIVRGSVVRILTDGSEGRSGPHGFPIGSLGLVAAPADHDGDLIVQGLSARYPYQGQPVDLYVPASGVEVVKP